MVRKISILKVTDDRSSGQIVSKPLETWCVKFNARNEEQEIFQSWNSNGRLQLLFMLDREELQYKVE